MLIAVETAPDIKLEGAPHGTGNEFDKVSIAS